jgi:hypothetical protein
MVAGAVKRRTVAIVAVAAALLVGVAAAVAASARERPLIRFTDEVPDDVRALAASTLERFVAGFPARADCIAPVELTVAWTFPDRADYDPDRRLVTLRVPATALNMEATLAHELAHHLEFTCHAISELRPAFLAAQGIAPGTPWFTGPTWERTPSEQYAEAVAWLVTGEPPALQRVALTGAALEVIRTWARMPAYVGRHT